MILNVIGTCNNSMLFTFLAIVKTILGLVHIIVPILLILSLTITLTKLAQDPDEKKAPKKILNSLLATFIIFFLPTIMNVVIDLVAGESNFSNCWKNASIKPNIQYQEIDGGNKQKIGNGTYEPGNKNTETGVGTSPPSNGSFNLEHAIKVTSDPHNSKHEDLPWHGATVGSHAGMIGAYVEAINILNGTNYTLLEIYNTIISLHPEQKNINEPVYGDKNKDVHAIYHIKVERAPANINEIKKALSEGKLVAEIVNTTKWRNDKGNLFNKKGRHTGLIFYFDGTYYHMKTSVQPNGIYTESQLKEWLGNTSTELVIYSKSNS